MNTVTVALDANSLSALENVTVTVGAAITGTVTVGNFPATQAVSLASVPTHAISGTVTANILSLPDNATGFFGDGHNNLHTLFESGSLVVSPISGTVTVGNTVTIAGTVTANPTGTQTIAGTVTVGNTVSFISVANDDELVANISSAIINSPLPAGTNRIGVVTIGAGSVTIGAGTAQIGSVTASISGTVPVSGTFFQATQPVSLATLPTLAAGTAQIGSVTASLAISSTAITSGSFASLTSATLVPGNVARKMATVYNLGAGQLFVNAGASATTLGGGFMVALSSGDFYECDYTTTTLSAIFATAGTASWVSH